MIKHVLRDEAGDGAGTVGGGGSAVAPAAAVGGAAASVASPVAAPAAWFGNDAEVAAYVAAKGWTDPTGAIKSYQHAEKMIGRDPNTLIQMPRADDAAGQRAVFAKLGMPESADKYDFGQPPAGAQVDTGLQSWAKETFHELGLTQAQAKGVAEKFAAKQAADSADHAVQYDAYVNAETAALQKEWGAGYEKSISRAKQAAIGLGIPGEAIDGIEASLGYAATMKLFSQLGVKMGEDGFVTPETRQAGFNSTLTPAEAKVQYDQKLLDSSFKSALLDRTHPGHKGAIAEQQRLMKLMHPEQE